MINIGIDATEETCTLPDFPLGVRGAVGFRRHNEGPTVCGGLNNSVATEKCFTLSSNHWTSAYTALEWTESSPMTTARQDASAINIDSTETLILGGYGKNGTHLKSSEVISANGARKGMDLPVSMVGHCSMKLSKSIVLIGGGFQDGSISSKMYYLNLKTMEFTPGPSMQTARTGHGCAALHLEDKTYGVISGGSNGTYAFDSTEMMDFDQINPTWTDGKQDNFKYIFQL